MSEELEPCPFCEETPEQFGMNQGYKWGFVSGCCCNGPEVRTKYDESKDAAWHKDAIKKWSTRPIEDKLKQEIEELHIHSEKMCQVLTKKDELQIQLVKTIREQNKSLTLAREALDEAKNKLELSISIHDRLELRDKLTKAIDVLLGKEKRDA